MRYVVAVGAAEALILSVTFLADASSEQIGTWVLAAAVIAGLGLTAKQMFWPSKPRDSEFATKGDLAEFRAEFLGRLDDLSTNGTVSMGDLKKEVNDRTDKLETYVREATHRTADILHNLMLKVERLITLEEVRTGHPPRLRREPTAGEGQGGEP